MGQRHSNGTGSPPYARLSQTSTLAMLHAAIADGESGLASQLAAAALRGKEQQQEQQRHHHQIYLDYRGKTSFGIEIRYSQTALALAIQYGQWATFRDLVESGLSPNAPQRMLVSGLSGQCCTRDFDTALELLVWALTKASYFQPYLSEAKVVDLLQVVMRHGVSPNTLSSHLLHKVAQAAVLDLIGAAFLDLETSTVCQRSALSVLRCLMQHGLSLGRGSIDCMQPLHHLLLCFLADPSETSAHLLQSNRKLRLALCIVINAACNSSACRRDDDGDDNDGGGADFTEVTADGLTNANWRSTATLWHYYAKIRRRQQPLVGNEDVAGVLLAHRALTQACGGSSSSRPPRLALLARNRVRGALLPAGRTSSQFSAAVAALPARRQLRQLVEFMDEDFLAPEIASVLSSARDADC